jgi:hypothetical protein
MKPNQTMKKCVEIALFPMEVLAVSQPPFGEFSHKDRKSIDLVGKDGGIDPVFAPYSGTITRVVGTENAVYLLSDGPVLCADGKERLLTSVFIHDNEVQVKVGQKVKQGEHFYDEGMAGRATGNHIHLDVASGHQTTYAGVLANSLLPQSVFYTNDTVVRNDAGLAWKLYKGSIAVEPAPRRTHKVVRGENLSVIAKKYGMKTAELYELNREIIGNNPNIIKIGQVLYLD